MNFKLVPLLALLALPALAQDPWQVGLGLNLLPSADVSMDLAKSNKAKTVAPALLVSYRAWEFGGSDLSLTGECQFKTQSTVTSQATVPGLGSGSHSTQTSTRFFAPGIQWNFHRELDFGFGLQYRFTRLEDRDSGLHANYNRPWINAYVGYTFKDMGGVKPYVALRLAASPKTTKAPTFAALLSGSDAAEADWLRSMSANRELSLQAGVRF